ncbi:MAG: hypothetical protein EOO29_18825 [Comamonadaceae bacterium]|nr:MAG: hypothetical protein EOO29_18825 [Comamonadaceae bacterium]
MKIASDDKDTLLPLGLSWPGRLRTLLLRYTITANLAARALAQACTGHTGSLSAPALTMLSIRTTPKRRHTMFSAARVLVESCVYR